MSGTDVRPLVRISQDGSTVGKLGVVLIVISGLPATGDDDCSTPARRFGAAHLSVDTVEEALLGAGLEQNLSLGLNVVVDAVNDSNPARRTWRETAVNTGRDPRFVPPPCPRVA
jgi:predicted kinase